MKFAKLMAESELVPKAFQGKAGNVLIAVQMGAEIGVTPMQAIQNIAVINGKPGIYGDLGKAILQKNGCKIEERDMEEVRKTGVAMCKITRPDGHVTLRTFSIDDAKTARLWGKEGPWTNYPYRQLSWRAFWFAARDGASDFLKGLAGAEELVDYPEDTVETTAVTLPRRASETAALPPKEEPAQKAEPTPPPPPMETTVSTVATIQDGKKFANGKAEVLDEEGVVYSCTVELAKFAHENKGKRATFEFRPNGDKRPELVSLALEPGK
jgi:hypothetical protein